MELPPGERIDLKKRIAATLGQQEWGDIDLTLSEFGFRTEDEWRGDRTSYVIAMLPGADDTLLLQLDRYLHPETVPTAAQPPDAFDDPSSPWSGTGLRLFLSHVADYAPQASALAVELAKRSVDGFVAHHSIEPAAEWEGVILSALRSCDACLALLTPGFRTSKWCDQEVGFCIGRDLLVVSVDYGETPYGFLGRYQSVPVRRGQRESDISLAVFEVLVRGRQSREAMAWALVRRWAATTSWDAARESYGLLKAIPAEAWTQGLVNEVWHAREQVYDLRTANINWESSEAALTHLFRDLPFSRPTDNEA